MTGSRGGWIVLRGCANQTRWTGGWGCVRGKEAEEGGGAGVPTCEWCCEQRVTSM